MSPEKSSSVSNIGPTLIVPLRTLSGSIALGENFRLPRVTLLNPSGELATIGIPIIGSTWLNSLSDLRLRMTGCTKPGRQSKGMRLCGRSSTWAYRKGSNHMRPMPGS
ncbi:hypothetical protein PGTUg99_022827 [Puccinia graminis f. sp. tritici]|uniref:Uncharacterized protein n=1 Tax=Puccinia graminis f. sp. tritici TaxID=56615 RepID=A0A5B0SIK7_PUCGR|nr:hypothetical protein PGTUg99_022827 [Puccinia graminis f. sp. tritici]